MSKVPGRSSFFPIDCLIMRKFVRGSSRKAGFGRFLLPCGGAELHGLGPAEALKEASGWLPAMRRECTSRLHIRNFLKCGKACKEPGATVESGPWTTLYIAWRWNSCSAADVEYDLRTRKMVYQAEFHAVCGSQIGIVIEWRIPVVSSPKEGTADSQRIAR
jgi:hypothetical protein